jgi:hypothetical protein
MINELNNKIAVLADLYLNYRDEDQFKEFADYNDIGLPIAHLVHTGLVTMNKEGEMYIEETYDLLIAAMGIDPDEVYETIDDMLQFIETKEE